jgi:hypothetical protein
MRKNITWIIISILVVITGTFIIILQAQKRTMIDYGVTTFLHGNVTNSEMQNAFLEAYQKGQSGQWQKIVYAYEGDPIIYNIRYQNQPFSLETTIDTRQDQFGPKYIETFDCQEMIIDGEMRLTGCIDVPNGVIVIP